MKKGLVSAILVVAAGAASYALAQKKPAAHKAHAAAPAMMNSGDMKWGDAPAVLPPGAKMAVMEGNPGAAGLFTVRLKAGDGYKIPAHWHPTAENVTVISGTFHVGMGDKLDEAKSTSLTAGGFVSLPAKMNHYAWMSGETEVQVHGMGPFKLTYANPADLPEAAKAAAAKPAK